MSFKSPSEMLDFDLEEEENYEKNLTTKLILTNSSEANDSFYITYKVKTNSPQKYFVKPNIGVIPPGILIFSNQVIFKCFKLKKI